MCPVSSHESILTDLSTNPEATSLHSTGSVGSVGGTGGTLGTAATPSESPSPLRATTTASSCSQSEGSAPEQPSGQGEGSKEKLKKRRSRSFLKRIESLRRKDKEKPSPEGRVAPRSSATLPPGWDSLKSNGDLAATRTNPSKRGNVAGSLHSKKHFFSVSYRTNRLPSPGGTKGSPDPKRSGVYLEDYDTPTATGNAWAAADCQRRARHGDCLVYIPCDHKPGTFPKSLSIESLCPLAGSSLSHWNAGSAAAGLGRGGSSSSVEGSSSPRGCARRRRGSCSSLGSRLSVYDNVPEFGSSEDFCKDREVIYENLDDILQDMWGLQQKVELWCKAVSPGLDEEEGGEEGEDEEESDSGGEPSNLHFEEQSMSDVGTSASDFDSTGNSLNEAEEMETRERRDSGVGASLTRPCRYHTIPTGFGWEGTAKPISFHAPCYGQRHFPLDHCSKPGREHSQGRGCCSREGCTAHGSGEPDPILDGLDDRLFWGGRGRKREGSAAGAARCGQGSAARRAGALWWPQDTTATTAGTSAVPPLPAPSACTDP